jgi:uncharacterized protein YceH (UPF0502 family)
VAKFRHLLDDALELTPSQLALLAVLMLRGHQTAAELRTRCERIYPFASIPDVEAALQSLADRELVQRLPRRPGEREERWTQLLGASDDVPASYADASPAPQEDDRFDRLEQEIADLRARLDAAGL